MVVTRNHLPSGLWINGLLGYNFIVLEIPTVHICQKVSHSMNETELVFAENSPYDSLEAVIEQDDDVAYFYLRLTGKQKYDMTSCWVRNFCKAPELFDKECMN